MRIDQYLVDKNHTPTRAKAQQLIKSGVVYALVGGEEKQIEKPSFKIDVQNPPEIIIKQNEVLKYVSRSGLKLEGAIEKLSLDVVAQRVLDIGQSTGGFTDCLLKANVDEIVGVDVGQGQLHSSLVEHPRVKHFEKINARELSKVDNLSSLKASFDLVVMDVSFISMTKLLGEISWALKSGGKLLSLVKPQFELEKQRLNKGGIVKDESDYEIVKASVEAAVSEAGFKVLNYIESPITGTDGNREFFIFAEWNALNPKRKT